MSEPTPGPWQVVTTTDLTGGDILGVTIDGGKSGFPIAALDKATPQDWAHARLIAAAPDLLRTLRQLHDNVAEYARINNLGGFDNHDMRQARAAIAKAEGKPHE